jgi:hypothetical protein
MTNKMLNSIFAGRSHGRGAADLPLHSRDESIDRVPWNRVPSRRDWDPDVDRWTNEGGALSKCGLLQRNGVRSSPVTSRIA